jgi:Ca-activated chloride channel family protein
MRTRASVVLLLVAAVATLGATPRRQERPTGQGFSFRTGVELISVSVTVTDERGRFVPGLRLEDFLVYEDGKPQTVQQFDAERVPVSLGIALDTSGSMLGEKIAAAQAAINRFLIDLLGPEDEVFLYRFDSRPTLVQGWTADRRAVSGALGSVRPSGGTAIYDAVAEALPLAQAGTRRKKALLLISDGNDTNSKTQVDEVQQMIRQSEVLIYAIGIDASGGSNYSAPASAGGYQGPKAAPVPSPFPGKAASPSTSRPTAATGSTNRPASSDRVNADILRRITDDSGGRTELIVSPRDLEPATAGIADELSRQYFLGYSSSLPKDGRWHTIDVRLTRPGNYTVRARRGFIAN